MTYSQYSPGIAPWPLPTAIPGNPAAAQPVSQIPAMRQPNPSFNPFCDGSEEVVSPAMATDGRDSIDDSRHARDHPVSQSLLASPMTASKPSWEAASFSEPNQVSPLQSDDSLRPHSDAISSRNIVQTSQVHGQSPGTESSHQSLLRKPETVDFSTPTNLQSPQIGHVHIEVNPNLLSGSPGHTSAAGNERPASYQAYSPPYSADPGSWLLPILLRF
jgi:hypothetical protein